LRSADTNLLLGIFDLIVKHHQPAPEGLVFARVAIDIDAHVSLLVGTLLRRRRQRHFQGAKHDVPGHVLFAGQRINQ
jgi:hypothetical protein